MDDPGWSWPAWKFGLKRDDLFTSLHDQYNTFTFSLQDPEAFRADVYEISHDASSTEEFHRLMAERRQQRLHELHESLESLAVEIIANPKLMDSEHWNLAVQLFRTKSFDSLVRYFGSYLPDGYMSRDARDEHRSRSVNSSFSDASSVQTASTKASSVDDAYANTQYKIFLDGPVMTEEPCSIDTNICLHHEMNTPLTPPASDVMSCQERSPSPIDDLESRTRCTNPSSRTMSFTGSELEPFYGFRRATIVDVDDDQTSHSGSVDTAVSSVSDCAESRSSLDSVDDEERQLQDLKPVLSNHGDDDDDDPLTAQFPEDAFDAFDTLEAISNTSDIYDTTESDTPTPRQEGVTTCSYIDYKSFLCRRLPSPNRRAPIREHRAGVIPPREVRRSPDEAHSKIQKPTPDPTRKRPKGRI